MRILVQCLLLCILLLLLHPCAAVSKDSWNIMTEELPPYSFLKDSRVHGISADILLLLMHKNGISIDRKNIQQLPWARAYAMAREVPGSILFSTVRTDEREPLFKWVGPITSLTLGLVALKERNIELHSLEDANKYTIGTIRDGVAEKLVLMGGGRESSLDKIASPQANIKKLQAGRIDLFAFSVASARYLTIDLGLDPDMFETVYILKQADLYFAFHLDTDEQLIRAFNQTLQEMKQPAADGTSAVDRIAAGYLEL